MLDRDELHGLSQALLLLGSQRRDLITHEPVVSPRRPSRINAIMQLCGFYEEADVSAFHVGLPGKSEGIIAIHAGECSIAVWSPRLNAQGNSHHGMKVLEALTTRTRSLIFG